MIKEVQSFEIKELFKDTQGPYRKYYVYEENNKIYGYIVIDIIYDRCEIIYIFVDTERRNQKIGTKLINYVIEMLKKQKCVNITLEVNKENTYAIKLYKKVGFKEVAIRKKYYDGVDGILMELIL